MLRIAVTAVALSATLACAGVLPSGLTDPLVSKAACEAFAGEVAAGGEPDLQAIAFSEGRMEHGIHSDDAKTATDLLFARIGGKLAMPDDAVSIYVDMVCRSL